jgi:hypothetical protein
MAPKDVHILMPRTWEYVTSPDIRDLADMVKLNLEMGKLSGIIWIV